MSLLRPTLGQMVDRLALLALKVGAAKAACKPAAHFEAEAEEVRRWCGHHYSTLWHGMPLSALWADLSLLHGAMWSLVARAEAGDETVSAVELHRLNSRRAEVREQIDRLSGEFAGREKV